VTTVELLPVHTFINDDFLLQKKLSNYWGYNSSGLFAPDPRYASNPAKCLKEPTRITRNDDLGRSAGQPARKG
jgi:glycogen operon protein